jgi:membrane-bound lytic murein transglycosylase
VIGLAADKNTLPIAKKIYALAFDRFEELRKPYETVVEIEQGKLPKPSSVAQWSSDQFVGALKHDQGSKTLDRNFRQLVHIAFPVASEMGDEYRNALISARASIEQNVTYNLYTRHIEPLFVGK